MNFKIENRILNIKNYPSVARHLEDMASRGWMVNKVLGEQILIYEKTEPREFDFSIVPYQNESFFKAKSKVDIENYKDENRGKGWEYAAGTRSVHIYYKERNSQAEDIIPSVEEEFKRIEEATKFRNTGYYILLPLLLFLSWNIFKNIGTNVRFIKSGLNQLLVVFFPIVFFSIVGELISTKLFVSKNRKNIYNGEEIEFSTSKYLFQNLAFILNYIFIFLFILYILYIAIFLKDTTILKSILPAAIGLAIGLSFRFFGKPAKIKDDYKPVIFIGAIIVTLVVLNVVVLPLILTPNDSIIEVDRGRYQVLMADDFYDGIEVVNNEISNDISFLAPESYKYTTMDDEGIYITTDYTRTLNEAIGANLVKRYKQRTQDEIDRWYDYNLEDYYYNGTSRRLEAQGLSREDLEEIKDEDIGIFKEKGKKLLEENMITRAEEGLWNADEAYYLDYRKDTIVLRKGRQVWTLGGLDFSDEEVRGRAMKILRIN